MMGLDQRASSEVVVDFHYTRQLNLLSDQSVSRGEKIAAIRELDKKCDSILSKSTVTSAEARSLFDKLWKPLVKTQGETIEKLRELGVTCLKRLGLGVDSAVLVHGMESLLPVLVDRLAETVTLEPSEEHRLLLLRLLHSFVDALRSQSGIFTADLVRIAVSRLSDSFPDVLKEACGLLSALAGYAPSALHSSVPNVVKAVMPLLTHKHAAVRASAVTALQKCISVDASPLKDVSQGLYSILDDKSGSVRQLVFVTASEWLLQLPDRWSTAYRTFPLVLAGLTDPLSSIAARVGDLLEQIGALYEEEWEDKVKDDLNYGAKGTERPRTGLRYLAVENALNIVNMLLENLESWKESNQLVALRILSSLLPLTETHISGYFGQLEPSIRKFLIKFSGSLSGWRLNGGKEAALSATGITFEALTAKVCLLLGKFVDPDVWTKVVYPSLTLGDDRSACVLAANLQLVNYLLIGSLASLEAAKLEQLIARLCVEDLLASQLDLNFLCSEILLTLVGGRDLCNLSLESLMMFSVLGRASLDVFCFLAPSVVESVTFVDAQKNYAEAITQLSAVDSTKLHEFVGRHFESVWAKLDLNYNYKECWKGWTKSSLAPRAFNVIISLLGSELSVESRFTDYVLPFWGAIAQPECDHYIKLDLLVKLKDEGMRSVLLPYLKDLVSAVILPHLVWRPGRQFIAVRREALDVLASYLAIATGEQVASLTISADEWKRLADELLEDDDLSTRRFALSAVKNLLAKRAPGFEVTAFSFSAAAFKLLLTTLAKRLDDADDDLRVLACATLVETLSACDLWKKEVKQFLSDHGVAVDDSQNGVTVSKKVASAAKVSRDLGFECFSGEAAVTEGEYLEITLDPTHFQNLVSALAIHLDDPDERVRLAVLQVFECLSRCDTARVGNFAHSKLSETVERYKFQSTIKDAIRLFAN